MRCNFSVCRHIPKLTWRCRLAWFKFWLISAGDVLFFLFSFEALVWCGSRLGVEFVASSATTWLWAEVNLLQLKRVFKTVIKSIMKHTKRPEASSSWWWSVYIISTSCCCCQLLVAGVPVCRRWCCCCHCLWCCFSGTPADTQKTSWSSRNAPKSQTPFSFLISSHSPLDFPCNFFWFWFFFWALFWH